MSRHTGVQVTQLKLKKMVIQKLYKNKKQEVEDKTVCLTVKILLSWKNKNKKTENTAFISVGFFAIRTIREY
jgi:hypothetical protein